VDLRDFIVTPFIIIGVYAFAYWLRPRLCDEVNYKYFFPALTVKIVGALALGFLYQFYYQGGDTFNYHTHGSRVIWEVFSEDPYNGIRLLFSTHEHGLDKFSSHIEFYNDRSSFFVVQLATLLDFVTFSSYSGTAVLFAFISFLGMWCLFVTFYDMYPHLHRRIAIATLFVPSVLFWGSGILKDTIVMACLGFATWLIKKIFIDRKASLSSTSLLIISLVVIFIVKKYVLLCYMPAVIFWVYTKNLERVQSMIVRLMIFPAISLFAIVSGYYAIQKVVEDDPKYALDKIANTARVTAYDIGFWSGRNAGSRYTLGELDGSLSNLISHMPAAVNVSLFRPYLWEVKNPLMLLSAVEALVLLLITSFLVLRSPVRAIKSLGDPNVVFCLLFSVSFAFAVGVSTYNFGTLNRYKIPLVPFYLLALVVISDHSNKRRKLEELNATE